MRITNLSILRPAAILMGQLRLPAKAFVLLAATLLPVVILLVAYTGADGSGASPLVLAGTAITALLGQYLLMGVFIHMLEGVQKVRAALINTSMGDLRSSITTTRRDELALLLTEVTRMQTALADTVRLIQEASDQIVRASAEIAQGTDDLSQRTETTASVLENSSRALGETTSIIQMTAQSVDRASAIAQTNASTAQEGGTIMSSVVQRMERIHNSSRKIGEIIGVIDSIAFQTNILALNAAVEAARAGEQGRGFAVVAAEVRSLAGRSAAAAKEIKELITASTKTVDEGVHLVDSTKQTMEELFRRAGAVNSLVSEIAAASREQSEGVEQVNQAVGQMDQGTQQNAALVEQSAAAAKSLEAQADHLQRAVSAFRLPGVAGAARRVPPTPLLQG